MGYALVDLLTVRRHRVDKATSLVAQRRKELAQAEQNLRQRETELADYREKRLLKEQALYDSIVGQAVLLKKLEEIKAEVQVLRFEELAYEERVLHAQKAVDDAHQQLQQAKQQLAKAVRAEEKLNEHRRLWDQEEFRRQQVKEDLELEELTFQPRLAGASA